MSMVNQHLLLEALVPRYPAPGENAEPVETSLPSFDAGVRRSPPVPGPTEGEFLIAVIGDSKRGGGSW